MRWIHLPIPDVSCPGPEFEVAWEKEGEALRALLRSGFDIVVHCKGGLGRAGSIAARLLIELGWDPPSALREVRGVRSGAVETRAQEEFVLSLDSLPEHQPVKSAAACRDRGVGALLGLAVGDAVGATLEFQNRQSRPVLYDMVGGGPFRLKPGQWTDDTSMALALADSLLQHGKLEPEDLMQRFLSWWRDGRYSCTGRCFDIGITTSHALSRFERTREPLAGSTDPHNAGNGSLMRLAPVVLHAVGCGRDPRELADLQSRTTHAAEACVESCREFGDRLYRAIVGDPKSEVLNGSHSSSLGAVGDVLEGSWKGKPRSAIRSSGYVLHSLEAALWCVGRTTSFAEAVLLAANLGDDADTTAAITGQLAGALYGASAIPEHWREKVAWREKIAAAGHALMTGRADASIFD